MKNEFTRFFSLSFFSCCIGNVNQFNWTATHPESWYSMKFKKCYYHWAFVVNDALLSALQPSSTNLQEKWWLQKYPQHTWNSGHKKASAVYSKRENSISLLKTIFSSWSVWLFCKGRCMWVIKRKLCAVRLFSHSEPFFVNLMWKQIF